MLRTLLVLSRGHFDSKPHSSFLCVLSLYNIISDWISIMGYTLFFISVVFPAQAEYSYFSADFRLKIFFYYS